MESIHEIDLQIKLTNEMNKVKLLQAQKDGLAQDMRRLVDAFEQVRMERDQLLEQTKPKPKPMATSPTKLSCMY